ncbi:MAG: hypothetical protein J2O49_02835 [Sciscionella sp.]|nr:hypothetical protein [Sciscionella sp.]
MMINGARAMGSSRVVFARLAVIAAALALLLGVTSTAPAAATAAADSPTGFFYGTDSAQMTVTGSGPYGEPVIGGDYGGYLGMVGNWAHWQGCGGKVVWSQANSAQANTNRTRYRKGIGTGVYWFMGGPGVDPHYNGTTTEAYAWGAAQAQSTASDMAHVSVTYPVVFADIELPGNAPSYTPAPDNGWNSVYTSPCSGKVKQNYVRSSLDRATFNGFYDYFKQHTHYRPGVYSAPDIWGTIFVSTGQGGYGYIPNTDEWTYEGNTTSLRNPPVGWCLSGSSTCARFFGGVTTASPHALIWQFSGGGGARNGYGDFDQIDDAR